MADSRPTNFDNNLTGTLLFDNSGVSGNPLAGMFSIPGGGQEAPGLGVKPFGMHLGVQVQDASLPPGTFASCMLDMLSPCAGGLQ